jgi:hypothetical protein
MNDDHTPEPNTSPISPTDTPPAPLPPLISKPIPWGYWARRLLVCNPFFLCSAALLLFGVNRLSLDPNFLGEEQSNLLFNYSALQLYGFLVVGTALILARRKIWYDSALLVVVEHGLALVPFMLISQGALIHRGLGAALALGAVALAAGRALAIHRWYPQFNLPGRALALGTAVLLMNVALPMIYPRAVFLDTENWARPNLWLWYLALPALVAGANFLPKPRRFGGTNPERHWLPLFIYTLWIAGTGAHFWCLAHISNQPFQIQWLGPAAVVAAWTMYRRISDCVPEPYPYWRCAMLVLACGAPLMSFNQPRLFEILVFVNALGFARLFLQSTGKLRLCARELLVLCLPLAVFGLPQEVGRLFMPQYVREYGPIAAFALLAVISSLRWFRVPLGVAGAVGINVFLVFIWPSAPIHAFVQAAMLFFLAHSLAWRRDIPNATALRICAALVWLLNSMAWVHDFGWRADVSVTGSAMILLGAWFAIWRVGRERPELTVPIAASAVILCAPSDWLLRQGSSGVIALAASGVLFAIGFVAAWTRYRWERSHATK